MGDDHQQAIVSFLHATTIAALKRALAFVENPDHPTGWTSDDPIILQVQGKSSRMVTRLITSFADRNEDTPDAHIWIWPLSRATATSVSR